MDEAYFRTRYEADAANKARQPWTDHLGWVKTFYEGKRFPPVPGWRSREEDILRKLPPSEHAHVRPRLHETGRLLASEWAKDNGVRKVSTADLQTWGKRFGDAAAQASTLEAALDGVRDELKRRGVA